MQERLPRSKEREKPLQCSPEATISQPRTNQLYSETTFIQGHCPKIFNGDPDRSSSTHPKCNGSTGGARQAVDPRREGKQQIKYRITQDLSYSETNNDVPLLINSRIDMEQYPEMVYGLTLPKIIHFIVALRLAWPLRTIFLFPSMITGTRIGRWPTVPWPSPRQSQPVWPTLSFISGWPLEGRSTRQLGELSPRWLRTWPMR